MDLTEAREKIAAIDRQMARLFEDRMETVRVVAEYKKKRGMPIEDKEQEAKKIAESSRLLEDQELRPYYTQFLQNSMEISKRWQHKLISGARVAYSGVEGAFAHIAAGRIFPDAERVSYSSFEEAYASVESGECDLAVLPIENSFAGEVGQVLDLMFSGPLHVNGVYDLSVTQNLIGIEGADTDSVKTVISHPQALSQCGKYIRKHSFEAVSAENTAMAAKEAAERGDRSVAAIASEETAELYGLKILDHDINEDKTNTTRFAVFSATEDSGTGSGGMAFLLLFTVKDEVGGLAKAINVISAYGFNMRVLRSRPMKNLPWHYYFYAEVEGDASSENGLRMLSALRGACPVMKIAGRYSASANSLQGGESI